MADKPDDYWYIPSPEEFENKTIAELEVIRRKIQEQIDIREDRDVDSILAKSPAAQEAAMLLQKMVERK
jgi:hypothetical protein